MKAFFPLLMTLCFLLTGCVFGGGLPEEAQLSSQVLLSVNYPGAGMGTRAMCASGEAYVYTDGTIRILMPDSSFEAMVEIAAIQMAPQDYAALADFAAPEKIARLQPRPNMDVCDGNSQFITLYADGEDGQPTELLKKGGYMARGKAFREMYRGIHERLDAYGVREIVQEWRAGLE